MRPLTAIGLISGTSADGIDAAIVRTDGETIAGTGAFLTRPYPADLRRELLELMRDPARAEHGDTAAAERAVTKANAETIIDLLAAADLMADDIDVVGMHGQTVLHRPERRVTRQLGDGAALRRAVGIPVVSRFRDADVASGGQGAPFVPLYHAALAAALSHPVAILNLGGVANVTYIDAGTLLAFDTGPASAMLDDWVARHTGAAYDEGGRIAASGTAEPARLAQLLDNPFFDRAPPKSLDRNDFPMSAVDGLGLADGAATLAAFTAQAVGRATQHLPRPPLRWLVTGGGRHNATLMALLRHALGVPVDPVEAVGWQGDVLEAQAFAFLAVRSLRGLPLSVPGTTGVARPMPGGILHGPNPVAEQDHAE